MTDRVAELLERVRDLSPVEREEFETAIVERVEREELENEPIDEALAAELGRRLRDVRENGADGVLVEDYFAELKARLRAKSA